MLPCYELGYALFGVLVCVRGWGSPKLQQKCSWLVGFLLLFLMSYAWLNFVSLCNSKQVYCASKRVPARFCVSSVPWRGDREIGSKCTEPRKEYT